MRGNTDFENEFDMALMNRTMAPEIESVYLIARLEHLFISGSRIREVARLGYDVSGLVPEHVAVALKQKYGGAKGKALT
jgi:pantetheine-phosphate adenylyltransferase